MDSGVKYHEALSLNDSGSFLRRLGPSLPWRFLTDTKPELQQPVICAPKKCIQYQHQVQQENTEFEQIQERPCLTMRAYQQVAAETKIENTPLPRQQPLPTPTPTPALVCPHHASHHANTCPHKSNMPCCRHQQMAFEANNIQHQYDDMKAVEQSKQLVDAAVSPNYELCQDQSIQADIRQSQSVEVQVGEYKEAEVGDSAPLSSFPTSQNHQSGTSQRSLFQEEQSNNEKDNDNGAASFQLDGSHLFQNSLQKLDQIIQEAAVDLHSSSVYGDDIKSKPALQQRNFLNAEIPDYTETGTLNQNSVLREHEISNPSRQVVNDEFQKRNKEVLSPVSSCSSFGGNLSPVAETTDSLEELERIIEEQHQQLVARGVLASTEELASSSSWTEDWFEVQRKKQTQSAHQSASIKDSSQVSTALPDRVVEDIQTVPAPNSCLSPIKEDAYFPELSNQSMYKYTQPEDKLHSIQDSPVAQFSTENYNNDNQQNELLHKSGAQSSISSLQYNGEESYKTSQYSDSLHEDDPHTDDFMEDLEFSRKQDTDLTKHAEALSCKIKSLLKQLQQEQSS